MICETSHDAMVNGMHGKIGNNLVVRTLRGKFIASQAPKKPQTQSEEQRKNRLRFREAAGYAKRMMNDPKRKEYYRKKAVALGLPNAYTAAITDFMRKPIIADVIAKSQTDGKIALRVRTFKKGFAIKEVGFAYSSERGATKTVDTPDRHGYYVCVLDKYILPKLRILVYDETENLAVKEVTMPDMLKAYRLAFYSETGFF